jgi:hypothetical protein
MFTIKKHFLPTVYPLIIGIVILGLPLSTSAKAEEQTEALTITTYYPAPYGVYKNMNITEKLIVGDGTEVFVDTPSGQELIMTITATGIRFHKPITLSNGAVLEDVLAAAEGYDDLQTRAINQLQLGVETIYKVAEIISFAMIFLGGTVYAAMVFALIVASDFFTGRAIPVSPPVWWP